MKYAPMNATIAIANKIIFEVIPSAFRAIAIRPTRAEKPPIIDKLTVAIVIPLAFPINEPAFILTRVKIAAKIANSAITRS